MLVSNSSISMKGKCVESFGSHYVMEEEERGEKCWRCMTIFRKHHNVLQYKESECFTFFGFLSLNLLQATVRLTSQLSNPSAIILLATLRCTRCSEGGQSQ